MLNGPSTSAVNNNVMSNRVISTAGSVSSGGRGAYGGSGGYGGGGFGASAYSAPQAAAKAAAPRSGEAAVNSSQASRAQRTTGQTGNANTYAQMAGADRAAGEALAQRMRTVASRTFYQVHDTWTDAGYDTAKQKEVIKIKAFSPAYFALTRRSPRLAQWAGLGGSVLVAANGKQAISFGATDGKESLTDAEVDALVKGL